MPPRRRPRPSTFCLGRGRRLGGMLPGQHCVDIVLSQALAVPRRAVQKRAVLIGAMLYRRPSRIGPVRDAILAPDADHRVDAPLDVTQRAHHLGGPLPGDVLERAGGVDIDRALVELVAERGIDASLPQRPGYL